jgi:hypothetical protein
MSGVVIQKLDASGNNLEILPDELSSLGNLNELVASRNDIEVVPVSILSHLTALTSIHLSYQLGPSALSHRLGIQSSLLPMLHPGLVKLDLRQKYAAWDPESLLHLGSAMVAVFKRDPIPTVLF